MLLLSDASLPTSLGGYRLVRVLGRDELATTALVHGDGEVRFARVFHPSAADAIVEAELAVHDALAAGQPEVRQHVAALDDLITLADGRLALLLTAVTGPTLHDVLTDRRGVLEPGEAVTVLAPLVATIEGAHEAGVTGIPLDPRRIRFAAGGAPVIVTVQGAVAGPVLPPRFRDHDAAYADDHRAVAALLLTVASSASSPAQSALLPLAGRARGDRPTVIALFDIATPIPIGVEESAPMIASRAAEGLSSLPVGARPITPSGGPVGAAVGGSMGDAVADAAPAPLAAVTAAMTALAVPERIVGTVMATALAVHRRATTLRTLLRSPRRGDVAATAAPRSGVRASTPPVRRSIAIMGAAGAAALVLAVVVATGTPASTGSSGTGPSSTTSPPVPVTFSSSTSGPRESAAPEREVRPEPSEWQALVTELVVRWSQCRARLADAGPSDGDSSDAGSSDADSSDTGPSDAGACTAGVTHPASAAESLLRTDDARHALLSSWLEQDGPVVVVERMGSAVLVDLIDADSETTAASLLLMRSEAGWRVRDVRG